MYYGLNKARRKLGPDATPAALATELGITEAQFNNYYLAVTAMDTSLDAMLPNARERQMGIPLAQEDSIIDLLDESSHQRKLVRCVDRLPAREQAVIRRRFLADPPETLIEIGKTYDVSRERIRQIEMTALKKLRRLVPA